VRQNTAWEARMADVFFIREFVEADRAEWSRLWAGYLRFYETHVPESVSEVTWRRLRDPEGPIRGYCAARTDGGGLLGIVHYLFHPVTWSAGPRCYLEDLYVDPGVRGSGAGRALIEAVYRAADTRGADQVYWLTAETNVAARRLYDRVATKTPFIKYRR
jgi:ribosomal protein S18 acetylase RimI-like enzyme